MRSPRSLVLIGTLVCLVVGWLAIPVRTTRAADETEGVSGVIHFRDGREVPFLHIGGSATIGKCIIHAYNGSQSVDYELSEVGEIIFANPSAKYDARPATEQDEAIVVSRSGKRFTLRGVGFSTETGDRNSHGLFEYVYVDPITKSVREGRDACRAISNITLGPDVGPMKRNPDTGEYFPAIYNFDPFTGAKLVWCEQPPK